MLLERVMVREKGIQSNTKATQSQLDSPFSQDDLDLLFRTLSDWSDYLEKDVPYFRDSTSNKPE